MLKFNIPENEKEELNSEEHEKWNMTREYKKVALDITCKFQVARIMRQNGGYRKIMSQDISESQKNNTCNNILSEFKNSQKFFCSQIMNSNIVLKGNLLNKISNCAKILIER